LIHNSYNNPNHSKKGAANLYLAANQREERKALNMISTLGKTTELLQPATNISSLSQNQRVTATVELTKQANSITSTGNTGGNNTKRKNFKNMFYSPKNNNREAYTEPHSKL
jgi:hypothetical protein